ncbi:uncharacterized protein RHO25_011735 [Cercospora beticola]|uniref:Trichodiene oxygenase n=2 Tax=Cercospora beticola TaxID=122368 RepID=A0ABZ0P5K4_CERBT|nr:hypothetical protein RHO25_011735 [Cercospora beticola]
MPYNTARAALIALIICLARLFFYSVLAATLLHWIWNVAWHSSHASRSSTGTALGRAFSVATYDATANFSIIMSVSVSLLLVWATQRMFYRLYFHPLAGFPGPRIAAFTRAYEFYYDVFLSGDYTFAIKEMHQRYGPIIRISPHELHIHDPDFEDELYTGASKPREKYPWALGMFGTSSGFIVAKEHDLHRKRRAPVNSFFSKKAVTELSPLIQGHIQNFCRRVKESQGTGKSLRLDHAYTALTMDIISDYSYGNSYEALNTPDMMAGWVSAISRGAETLHINKFFPWFIYTMKALPAWLVVKLNPSFGGIIQMQEKQAEDVDEVIKSHGQLKKNGRRTIFHELWDSPELLEKDHNRQHMLNEAQTFIGAGTFTTSSHLTNTTFHLLDNPACLQRLQAELRDTITDASILPPLSSLEKLPYLTAVIQEGHRLAVGVGHRLARISPVRPIQYKDWTIPPGVPVGMSNWITAFDPALFPDPHTFRPERFLHDTEGSDRARKLFSPYSKGTRSCLGMNLAQAELYMTLATVFGSENFDFKLWKTVNEDVEPWRDYFSPWPRNDARGLRVLVE